MWILLSFISIFFYAVATIFQKIYHSQKNDSVTVIKDLFYSMLLASMFGFLLNILGLGESGKNPIELMMDEPISLLLGLCITMEALLYITCIKIMPASIVAPFDNLSAILGFFGTIILYTVVGINFEGSLAFTPLRIMAVVLIIFACVGLSVQERRELLKTETDKNKTHKKFTSFLMGLLLIFICQIFTAGDTVTGAYAIEMHLFGVSDIMSAIAPLQVLVSIGCYIYICIKTKSIWNIFDIKREKYGILDSACDVIAYLFTYLADVHSSVFSPILISTYGIFILPFSRVILKEKLSWQKYACLIAIVISTVLFSLAEVI